MNAKEILEGVAGRKQEILRDANIDPREATDFIAMIEIIGEMLGYKGAAFFKKSSGPVSQFLFAMLIESTMKSISKEAEAAFMRATEPKK